MSRGEIIENGRLVGTFPLPAGTRNASLPRPQVPADTVPLDRTPRADALAVDSSIGSYALKRLSPFKKRWPEVLVFDTRVMELEQKQAGVNAELIAAQQQLTRMQETDRDRLAGWVADPSGDRPLPAAPGVAQRISDLEQERDALTTATQHVLDEKTLYVDKHRNRLVREAAKARARAVEQLQQAITAVESVRSEVVDCVAAERWAAEYPGEAADASSLRLAHMKGGRLSTALPDFRGLAVCTQVTEWLRDDCRWLSEVLKPKPGDGELDVKEDAVWESTDEGRAALERERQNIIRGLQPKNVRSAGWGN